MNINTLSWSDPGPHPGGRHRQRADDTGGEDIAVEVRDTGPGIPEKEIPHVFDRFYQSAKGMNGTEGHSGLGLAITRRIIELHNRSIRVESVPGKGTRFTFRLPIHLPKV